MIFRQLLKIEQDIGIWILVDTSFDGHKKIRGYLFIKYIECWVKLAINGQHMSLEKDILIFLQLIEISKYYARQEDNFLKH